MRITDERIRFGERMVKRAAECLHDKDMKDKVTVITTTAVITAIVTVAIMSFINR